MHPRPNDDRTNPAHRSGSSPTLGYAYRAEVLADLAVALDPEVQVCTLPRPGSPAIFAYLDGLAARRWRGLRGVSTPDASGSWAADALALPDLPGRAAFAQDLASLLELYADLLGCPAIGLRLECLDRAMCPGWHLDRTGIRLLCTYRGPGTEWLDDSGIDPRALPAGAADRPPTGRANPFDILLLKGSLWQGNAGRGAIHRSPQVPPGSGPRVLLALDALWDD